MDEVQKKTAAIKNALSNSATTRISERDFQQQSVNFIVGNAFDVFNDPNAVSRGSVISTQKDRLNLTK